MGTKDHITTYALVISYNSFAFMRYRGITDLTRARQLAREEKERRDKWHELPVRGKKRGGPRAKIDIIAFIESV